MVIHPLRHEYEYKAYLAKSSRESCIKANIGL